MLKKCFDWAIFWTRLFSDFCWPLQNKWFKTQHSAFWSFVHVWQIGVPTLTHTSGISWVSAHLFVRRGNVKGQQLGAEKRNEARISAKTDSFTWKHSAGFCCLCHLGHWFFVKLWMFYFLFHYFISPAMVALSDWHLRHGWSLRSDLK